MKPALDPSLQSPIPKKAPMNATAAVDFTDRLEVRLRRELLSHPDFEFERLVVRRVPGGGVCLEGVMCSETDVSEVAGFVSRVTGATEILNKLVVWTKPFKG
ncbi:hypothetical protein [Thalassoroseus pseudoceratinae]|uniref:hypothetical protein n=1 Tax=Thalassoroseus pseudoceratinae TaxID=2713176 RepID=UPI00141FBEED|nr:hypothetical protein [Thalassoroseus pseudoceratinae]